MKILGAALVLLWVLAVAVPAAAQICQALPKQVTGKVLPSSDGVATTASPGFTAKATNTRTGSVATSSTLVGTSFWFDAGSTWGTWCVGDTVQVAVTVSTASGTYSAAVTKALTTDNPEVFPDGTLVPGDPPPPQIAASATPTPLVVTPVPTPVTTATATPVSTTAPVGAPPGQAATPPSLPLPTPTPRATAAPLRTPTPATTPTPPGLAPASPAATPVPGDGTFLPPLPAAPARSPGFEVLGAIITLGLGALWTRRKG